MEGRILTFNRAAETITALAASDVVGRRAAEIMQLPEVFRSLFVPGATPSGTQRHEFGYQRWDGRADPDGHDQRAAHHAARRRAASSSPSRT